MDVTGWQEVRDGNGEVAGRVQAPGPDGRYPGDAADVFFETEDGEPVAVARCDLDYFGMVDDALVPQEIADLSDVVPLRAWWKS